MPYMIWVTTSCNMKCKYCYEGVEKENVYLNFEMADKVISYIESDFDEKKESELLIEFHGGEPLLNIPVIKYLTNKIENKYSRAGIKTVFQLTTNATLLDDTILEFLKNHIQNITVSIDGSEKTHNLMRKFNNGNDSYELTMKNSRILLREKKDLRVRMTVTPETLGNLFEDVLHLVNEGFKLIVPVLDVFDTRWDDEMFEQLRESIQKIKKNVQDKKIAISITDPLRVTGNCKCDGGYTSKNIYPNGNLYPCTIAAGNNEFLIGNISEGINYTKLKKIMSFSDKKIQECEGCCFYNSCNSIRCRILNKLINGSYLKPQVVECRLNSILYEENGFQII